MAYGQYSCFSVAQPCLTLSDPHGLKHARIRCSSSSPGAHSKKCPLALCHPHLLPSIFSSESVLCIRWPRYRSFGFSISPSIDYSELISFRIDWFDLLAVQGTLKSLKSISSSALSLLYGPIKNHYI